MRHVLLLHISYTKIKLKFYSYFQGKFYVAYDKEVSYAWKKGMSTTKEKSECNPLPLIRGGKCKLNIFKGFKSRLFVNNSIFHQISKAVKWKNTQLHTNYLKKTDLQDAVFCTDL